jgi:hypothetical protein
VAVQQGKLNHRSSKSRGEYGEENNAETNLVPATNKLEEKKTIVEVKKKFIPVK